VTTDELVAEEEEAFKRKMDVKLGGMLGIVLACLFFFLGCLFLLCRRRGYHFFRRGLPVWKSSDNSTKEEGTLDGLPEVPSHTLGNVAS
jgi:hypothetical protein